MALRSIRRPLALSLLPWLLVLLAGVAALGVDDGAGGPAEPLASSGLLPTGGCTYDPNGCS